MANLVPNPGFEVDTSGWTGDVGAIDRVTTEHHSGVAALEVVVTNPGGGGTKSVTIPVVGGESYAFVCWVKGSGSVALLTNITYGEDEEFWDGSGPASLGSEWQQLAFITTVPSFATGVRITVAASNAATFYLDDVSLDGPPVNPVDATLAGAGDMSASATLAGDGGSIDGAADLSASAIRGHATDAATRTGTGSLSTTAFVAANPIGGTRPGTGNLIASGTITPFDPPVPDPAERITPDLVRIQADDGSGTWPHTFARVKVASVSRGEAEPGTMRLEIHDATYDPVSSTALRTGQSVRLQVTGGGTADWRTIASGKVTDPATDYDPRPGANVPVNVKVEAADQLVALQNIPESRGVGTIDELRWLCTEAGVPFVINGSLSPMVTGTVVATNDNASLWDQVLVTRDSVLGYAWVDMENRLRAYDSASMPTASVASLTPAVYSDIDMDFALDQIINTVTVNWRRYDIGTEKSADVPYGPYKDQPSVDSWGERTASFTIQGATEVEGDIVDFAQEVLIRNKDAEVRPRTVRIPIREPFDLKFVRDIDINSRVTVTYPDGVTTKVLRVVGIDHNITPHIPVNGSLDWMMTVTLALPNGVAIPSQTPGTGVPNVPDNVVTDDQLDAVVQDLLDAVQEALDEANEAANFAQSKNTVYRQTTKPTDPPQGPFRAGDIWFDSDDGNRIWIYVEGGTNDFVLATGSYLTTPNGKLVVTPSGLFCYDAANNLKFVLNAGNGDVTMSGGLIAGGDVNGATVTGGTVQSTALPQRGIKINSTHLIAYDAAGNPTLSITAATGAIAMLGELLSGSTITGARFRTQLAGARILIGPGQGIADNEIAFYTSGTNFPPGAISANAVTDSNRTLIITGPASTSSALTRPQIVLRSSSGTPSITFNSDVVMQDGLDVAEGVEVGGDINADGTVRAPAFRQLTDWTTGDAANCRLTSDGFFRRVTSSLRYKDDVGDLPDDLADTAMRLRMHTYTRNDDDTGRRHVGAIAEEADELGLGMLVDYDDQGRPDGFAYQLLAVMHHQVIQRQAKQIADLTARLEALEGK